MVARALAPKHGELKGSSDPYRIVLFVLLVITISRIHQHFAFLRPLRPALTLVLLALIYAYLNPKYLATGSIFGTWAAKVVGAIGLMACLSVPLSISIGGSATFILFEFSKVLLFSFLLIAGIRHARDLYRLVWGFVIASGFLAYLSLFVFRLKPAGGDFVRIQNAYTYDSNDLGLVAIIGVAMTLLIIQVTTGKKKLLGFVILAGLGMTIARTGSRGAFIGLMALGLAMLVLLKSVSLDKRLAFVIVTVVAVALAAPRGYWDHMLTVFSPKEDYNWSSPTGRRQVFLRGVGYMMRNPLTGIGVGNFGRAEGNISDLAAARRDDPTLAGLKWSAAHNSFLEAAAEMGIPGAVLFCTLVFGGIVHVLRVRSKIPDAWAIGSPDERFLYYTSVYLPVALFGFAASGFFVSFAYLDPIYVLAAYMAGLDVSIEALRREGETVGEQAVVTSVRQYRGGLPPHPRGAIPAPPPKV